MTVNDPPEIEVQTLFVRECAVKGDPVEPLVNASDPDFDVITYTIINGDPTGDFTFLNKTQPNITVTKYGDMDFEGQFGVSSYDLVITVADRQYTTGAHVAVEVTDCNGAPSD